MQLSAISSSWLKRSLFQTACAEVPSPETSDNAVVDESFVRTWNGLESSGITAACHTTGLTIQKGDGQHQAGPRRLPGRSMGELPGTPLRAIWRSSKSYPVADRTLDRAWHTPGGWSHLENLRRPSLRSSTGQLAPTARGQG